MEDDNNSIFSDWKSGERSSVKVSLVLMGGIMVLALLIVAQGYILKYAGLCGITAD